MSARSLTRAASLAPEPGHVDPERRRARPRIALALALAGVLALPTVLGGQAPASVAAQPLKAGADFTVTSALGSLQDCGSPALLAPGVPRCLVFTVRNRLRVPITVQSIAIAGVASPAGCPASNLDLTGTGFTGALAVPAGGRATTSGVPIVLVNAATNQDGCRNVTFTLTYTGGGTYTQSMTTSLALVVAPAASAPGQPVTLTATVAASRPPSGTVSYYRCTDATCGTTTLLGTTSLGATGVAILSVSDLPSGVNLLYAVYSGDASFTGSASPVVTQVVGLALAAQCTGTYSTVIVGDPNYPRIDGTEHADLIYAIGASYTIASHNGGDCVIAGDGDNTIVTGSQADVIVVGNGNNTIDAGSGDDLVVAGNGTNRIVTGPGLTTVVVGDGSGNTIYAHNGSAPASAAVTLGSGSGNTVILGDGASSTVRILGGGSDVIRAGHAAAVVHLGTGNGNAFYGLRSYANVCYLPAPPGTWTAPAPEYYAATLVNCRIAVTP